MGAASLWREKFARAGDESDTRAALLPLLCARANSAQKQSLLFVVMFASRFFTFLPAC
jgi:hypothetical protein